MDTWCPDQEHSGGPRQAPSLTGPVYSAKCERLWRDHETFLSYTEYLSVYTELQVIKGELALLIESLEAGLNQEVEDLTPSPSPSLSSSTTTTASIPEGHCNRLKVKMPTFSREILEWLDFRRTFEPLLQREHGLTDAEKIAHLLSSMQGAEALSEAKIAAGSYDSYKKVVDHLKMKYDQPKVVYRRPCAQTLQAEDSVLHSSVSFEHSVSAHRPCQWFGEA